MNWQLTRGLNCLFFKHCFHIPVFSGTLQLHCKFRYCRNMAFVDCLSVCLFKDTSLEAYIRLLTAAAPSDCVFRALGTNWLTDLLTLSVTRVYCDKTTEVRIMQFSLQYSAMPCLIACQVRWRNSNGFPSIGSSDWDGVVFYRICDAVSRKRCEIELRWQLITNRKSYVGFQLQNSRWPWMTLNVNLLLCRQCYAYCEQMAEAKISRYSL